MPARILSEKPLFDGHFLHAKVLSVALENEQVVAREIIKNPGAVAIVPLWADGTVTLVKQYRAPIDAQSTEVPAGLIDKEEALEAAALRELAEETGIRAEKLFCLGKVASSPGFSSEIVHLYAATGLTGGETAFDEDEVLTAMQVPLSEAYEMVLRGEICNASTVSAIMLTLDAIRCGRIVP